MTLPVITHPTHKIKLPISDKEVTVRPMLVREEKILLMAKTTGEYSDMLNSVRQVVNNCVVSKDVDVGKLPIFELEYLFIRLRAVSVNSTAKVTYKDRDDDKNYDFEINLDDIKISRVMEKPSPNTVKINENLTLLLKFPDASLYADKEFQANPNDATDLLLMKTIDKLMDGDKMVPLDLEGKEKVAEFVDNLPIQAFNAIKEFWGSIPTLFYEIKYTNSLGKERVIPLTTLQDFFTLV